MTIIREFRVILPISVEEYQVGQLYSVAEASKDNTGGGEGVEVVKNEPYQKENGEKGQYTFKIFRMASKVPLLLKRLMPKGSLVFHEHAWNAYPYCKTVITNPDYMKDRFEAKIETWHKSDLGTIHNVHNLDKKSLKSRDVVMIDIANDAVTRNDYRAEFDPKIFKSVKQSHRAPLRPSWIKDIQLAKSGFDQGVQMGLPEKDLPSVPDHMCAYKLVTLKFQWLGFQSLVEGFGVRQQRRVFTLFHRQVFCWLDQWYGLNMGDIRALEDKTKEDLADNFHEGDKRGYTVEEAD